MASALLRAEWLDVEGGAGGLLYGPLGPLDVGFGANTDGGERFGLQLGARF